MKLCLSKIAENLDFVENSNFIRGSTKVGPHVRFGVNRWKFPVIQPYFSKVIGLKPGTLFFPIIFPKVFKKALLQDTYERLLLEVASVNILKNSCSENYFNL